MKKRSNLDSFQGIEGLQIKTSLSVGSSVRRNCSRRFSFYLLLARPRSLPFHSARLDQSHALISPISPFRRFPSKTQSTTLNYASIMHCAMFDRWSADSGLSRIMMNPFPRGEPDIPWARGTNIFQCTSPLNYLVPWNFTLARSENTCSCGGCEIARVMLFRGLVWGTFN